METTEKIVESYCRYVRKLFTIPNIKRGNNEIDLLAISSDGTEKFHIETSIVTGKNFTKLTGDDFVEENLSNHKKAAERRKVDFFEKKKFNDSNILSVLNEYGFSGNYKKVIVTLDWTPEAQLKAIQYNIELWNFNGMLFEIMTFLDDKTSYFSDDTLRTVQLVHKAIQWKK